MPSATITSTAAGVTLTAADYFNPVTVITGAIVSGASNGISAATDWSIVNLGSVSGTGNNGILLQQGGTIDNTGTGAITGNSAGVRVDGLAGTVTNAGLVSGTSSGGGIGVYFTAGGAVDNNGSTAAIIGAAAGVNIGGGTGTVTNIGTITGLAPLAGGLSNSAGVQLRQGGSVSNGQSGSSGGQIYGYSSGVYVYGPTSAGTSLGAGSVTNFGTIIGRALFGVALLDGGSVSNGADGAASAYIYGGSYGVVTDFFNSATAPNVTSTVTNFGTIVAGAANSAGVGLRAGGSVVNAAGATIIGGYGVIATAPSGTGMTVVNAGTITGTGANGFAVFFQTNDALLVNVPGAVFNGTVATSGSATMELASAASVGTLTGLGSLFQSFDTITVDGGAQWELTGANTVASGVDISVASGAALQVGGSLPGAADIAIYGGMIAFGGTVDSGTSFDFADSSVLASVLSLGTTNGITFDNAITSFGAKDQVIVNDVTFAAGSTPLIGGGGMTIALAGGGTFTFTSFAFEGATDQLVVDDHSITDIACFAAGTPILTDQGTVPVEALRHGDRVITLDGTAKPVRWVGHRRLDLARHPEPRRVQPIRIGIDAFAEGVPNVDLLVSPDHALFIDGVLVPARLLLNGATIVQEQECRDVHYLHVELERHDVLFAAGVAAETFLDTGNRGVFENAAAPLVLHPDLAAAEDGQRRREADSCAPLVTDAARAEAVWRQIACRARELGYSLATAQTTGDPALLLLTGGRVVQPLAVRDGRYMFALPSGGGDVRLVSRATAPCDVTPWVEDRRALGIMLRRIAMHRGDGMHDIALDSPLLGNGWWPLEGDDAGRWRWSDGSASLALPLDATMLEVEIGAGMAYLADPLPRAA